MDLQVLITSSSRPQLFPWFWESYKRMCIMSERPKRITVHEDFVFPNHSNKVIEYLKTLKAKGEIDDIEHDNPAKGLGWTLGHYIERRLTAKYVFYLQEDWYFERKIDIDAILKVMDENPEINLIFFNKIKNNGVINKQEQREFTYSGMKMCLYHGWTFLPGIWRLDFVKKHWPSGIETRPEGRFTNVFGTHEERGSVELCKNRIGAYIYGEMGDFRQVRHIGNDVRMASWRLENGKPSGRHDKSMDLPYMAPGVEYPEIPTKKDSNY